MDILGSSNNVNVAIETVETNVLWMQQHETEIRDWLRVYRYLLLF